MKTTMFLAFIIGLASVAPADAFMGIEARYKLCMQRRHSNCAERVALAKQYGYWINARGEQRPIR